MSPSGEATYDPAALSAASAALNSALPLPLSDDGFEGVLGAVTRAIGSSTKGSEKEVGNRLAAIIDSCSTGAALGLSKTVAIGADVDCDKPT